MRTHWALQHMALLKATQGKSLDTTAVTHRRILELAQSVHPLSLAQVAMLEHFVHSNSKVLNNTVYYDEDIFHPSTHSKEDYYVTATGRWARRGNAGNVTVKKKKSDE